MSRNRNNAEATEATEAAVEGGVVEQAVESTETVADESTETATDAAPKAEPKPVDLSNFKSAVASVVTEATSNGGEITDEHLATVNEAYGELEGPKAKSAARTFLKDSMGQAVDDDDMASAKAYHTLASKVEAKAAKKSGGSTPKAPADPTDAFVEHKVSLELARALLVTPEGLATDVEERVQKLYAELYPQVEAQLAYLSADKETRGDEPEAHAVAKVAAKLASGKKVKATSTGGGGGSTRTYEGKPRSIKKHIEAAFAAAEEGAFLKVNDIVKFTSDEYGQDHPSAGAVSGALKSASFDLPGIVPGNNGGQGAWKRSA